MSPKPELANRGLLDKQSSGLHVNILHTHSSKHSNMTCKAVDCQKTATYLTQIENRRKMAPPAQPRWDRAAGRPSTPAPTIAVMLW